MANKFLIKRGSAAPNNAAIDNYELVYNYTDNELWTKHNGSVVKVASGNVGTVTNVVAGNGLTGGGTSTATLDLDFSELTDMTGDISGTTEFILQNGTVESRKAASEINLSAFNNDLSLSSGTVTSVTAGTGMTQSGTSTVNPTLNVVGENGLVASANAIGLDLSPLSAVGVNNLVDEDLFAVEIAIGGAIKKLTASSLKTYIGGGTITSVTGMTDNNVLTASGSTTISGESNLTFDGTSFEVENSSNGRGVQLNTNSEIKSLDGASWLHLQRYVDGNVAVGSNSNSDLYVANQLGVGTSSPASALHVVAAGLSNSIRASNTTSDATTKYGTYLGSHYTNSEEPVTGMLITSGSASATGSLVTIGGGVSAANAVNIIRFYTAANNTTLAGTERMRIDNSGNVGIGVVSPNSLLHLYSTSNTQLRLQTTGTANASNIVYQNGTASYSVGINSAEQFSFYSSQLSGDAGFINTNGWLYWYNPILLTTNNTALKGRDSGGTVRDMLKIDANNDLVIGDSNLNDVYINQNVGIGTASPTSKVHIYNGNGSIPDDANNHLLVEDDGHSYIGIGGGTSSDTGIHFMDSGGIRGRIAYKHSSDAMDFKTANAVQMTINSSGNVGIGVDAPLEELDIAGSLKVRGDSSVATEVLELGQFVSPNVNTPQYTFNTYDAAGGLPSMGDHLEIRSVRWGQSISFSRNGQGGAVPTALFYNGSSSGYMELYKALNPTTDATYQANVKLNVNGDSFFRGGSVTIGDVSPLTVGGTPRLSLQGAGLNIGANANDLSYIRRIDTGDYQWQTWNGSNDGQIHLQPYGGSVGIGTTSPAGKLMVREDTAGSPTRIIVSNNGTAQSGTTSRLSFYEGTSEKSYIERRRDGTGKTAFVTPADDNPFVWENATGEFMRFTNSNVGIGVTSPLEKLHVAAPATQSLKNALHLSNNPTDTSNAVGNGVAMTMGLLDGAYSTKIATVYEGNNPSYLQPALAFYTMHNTYLAGSETEKMRISSSGNVGIGMSSNINERLNVYHSSSADVLGIVGVGSAASTNFANINFRNLYSSATGDSAIIGCDTGSTTDKGELVFSTSGGSMNATEKMRITSGGNVGIGQVSPGYKLDVSGTGRFTGLITASGGIFTDGSSLGYTSDGYSRASSGNASVPGFSFASDTDTGMYRANVNSLGFTTAGNFAMVIDNSQNVGIGTVSPSYKLDITHAGSGLRLNSSGDQQLRFERTSGNAFSIEHDTARMYLYNRTTSAATVAVTNAGNFGIGTVSPAALLHLMSGDLFLTANSTSADSGQGIYWQSTTSGWNTGQALGAIFGKRVDASNGYLRFDTRSSGTTAERMRLINTGALHVINDVVAFSSTPSDKKLKTNVKNIDYGLDTIMKLNPKQYDWKKDNRHDIGFIAQEVEEVIPEIVKDNEWFDDKIKTMDYEKLTAVLIKAVQEQQEQINELKEKLNG